MSLRKHAEHELDLIGMTEDSSDEMNRMMRVHILRMVDEFTQEGHSGFSANYAINILSKVLRFKPLSPLTGEDSEWNVIETTRSHLGGEKPVTWQNRRYSSVFKSVKEGAYDIDGRVFWEWNSHPEIDGGKPYKSHFTSIDSKVPVTFPYTPPEKPEYVFRPTDAFPNEELDNE